ncbi:hypothetical protein WN51_04225 [Melipona quadrifasciata]|uniref:LITAF domain-containing protein n=1 Tax=Melipona quadrifasciata TaxID=166423 RepID=A0A0N0U408_9HYME|nr:hypothetical protein WN51_04225 [Melipona quadrifasciata]
MEKNKGFATQPSAPPPSAPPSYEEAVENAAGISRQPNIPPYPVGPSSMPIPTHNQPLNQTTVPYPPNYSGPSTEPLSQPQTQYNANPNTVPPPEFRVVYQPVIYSLSPNPTKTTCPTCHTSIKTTTISDHQPSAHLCCIVLCLLGLPVEYLFCLYISMWVLHAKDKMLPLLMSAILYEQLHECPSLLSEM